MNNRMMKEHLTAVGSIVNVSVISATPGPAYHQENHNHADNANVQYH